MKIPFASRLHRSLAALAMLCAATACASVGIRPEAFSRHPTGGSGLVDVGDHRLFFECTAAASTTVVLEAGGGATGFMWQPVQRRLAPAPDIQVCQYDRAGHGRSEPASGPYRIEDEVAALRAGLDAVGASGRLVLVGASYGGFIVRLYASRYPEEVAGVVYVDANTVEFFDRHPEIVDELAGAKLPFLARIAPSWLVRKVGRRRMRHLLRFEEEQDNETLLRLSTTKKHLRATIRMNRGFRETLDVMRGIRYPAHIPTVVITRGRPTAFGPWTSEARERDWREAQAALVDGVTNARRMIAERSDHAVSFDQPELIERAVLDVVSRKTAVLQGRTPQSEA